MSEHRVWTVFVDRNECYCGARFPTYDDLAAHVAQENAMDFDTYQDRTADTAIYPGQGGLQGLCYCALGLGEAGEVQGKVKKILRDHNGVVSDELTAVVAKELGDLLWYCAQLATELDLPLSEIAQANLDKLADRKQRGVLQGNGDDR